MIGMMLRELTHPRTICLKGFLFLVAGSLASLVLWMDSPSFKTAALIAITVWCFARFYYFAFYVIGKYVDPHYRFAGLWSAVRHVLATRKRCHSERTRNESCPNS